MTCESIFSQSPQNPEKSEPRENNRKHGKNKENEGRAENEQEHKQKQARSSEQEADAQDRATRTQRAASEHRHQHSTSSKANNANTTRNTRDATASNHPTRPALHHRDPRDKKKMCGASKVEVDPLRSRSGP